MRDTTKMPFVCCCVVAFPIMGAAALAFLTAPFTQNAYESFFVLEGLVAFLCR